MENLIKLRLIRMQTITFQPIEKMTHEQMLEFCRLNQGLRCEMNANGSIILKTPFSKRYVLAIEKILHTLITWNDNNENGVVLDSKTGYVLPNSAVRHPVLSWSKSHKLSKQKEHLIEAAPDFFVEFLTEFDNFSAMKIRMKEYISNGSLLGWLLDLSNGAVHVFRNDGSENVVQSNEKKLSGGSILRGYELDLNSL